MDGVGAARSQEPEPESERSNQDDVLSSSQNQDPEGKVVWIVGRWIGDGGWRQEAGGRRQEKAWPRSCLEVEVEVEDGSGWIC